MGNIKSIKMKKQKALILIDLQNDYFEGGLYPLVGSLDAVGKSSVSCPLKPSDSTPLKHSTMPP